MEVQRISELFPQTKDNKVSVEEVLDKDIIIWDCDLRDGDYGQWVIVTFSYPDKPEERLWFGTSGTVLVGKLMRVKGENRFPVLGRVFVAKGNKRRYYDIM